MRWLKGLVIGMGVLILAGLTVVIVTVVKRANVPVKPETSISLPSRPVAGATGAADRPGAAPGFADRSIAIPPGATTEEITSDTRRLIVRLHLASGKAALLLIDAVTGKKIGLITLDESTP